MQLGVPGLTSNNAPPLWYTLGQAIYYEVFTGLFKPSLAVTGTDFAGQIEAAGENIKSFKVGDKVNIATACLRRGDDF